MTQVAHSTVSGGDARVAVGIKLRVLDVPIRAVIGGLHLPVHATGTPLVPQAVIGNPRPPWRPIGERDAEHVLAEIQARGPRLVALSGHDSTPWTFDAFTRHAQKGRRRPVVHTQVVCQVPSPSRPHADQPEWRTSRCRL